MQIKSMPITLSLCLLLLFAQKGYTQKALDEKINQIDINNASSLNLLNPIYLDLNNTNYNKFLLAQEEGNVIPLDRDTNPPNYDSNEVLKGTNSSSAPLQASAVKEFHILNDIQLEINDITGPGKAASSLKDGVNYLENLNIYARGEVNKFQYDFNLGGRATDNDRYDVKELSFTTLQGHLGYADHHFKFGDVFDSFSQYTLNSALKGFSYNFYDPNDNLPELSLIYGYDYPRWESFFRDKEVRSIQRVGFGGHISHMIPEIMKIGATFLRTQDSDRVTSFDKLYRNNLYSFDYELYPLDEMLTIKGETAFAQGCLSPQAGLSNDSYWGSANRVSLHSKIGRSKILSEYERVSPEFVSLLGSAPVDREKVKTTWRYNITKNIQTNVGFLWFMNSLNDPTNRTHDYKPEFDIIIKKIFHRKYAKSRLSYKFDVKAASGKRAFNQFANLNYSDRFGFLDVDTNFGFNSYFTNKNRNENYEYTYNTTLSSRHKVGYVVLKPSLTAGTFFYDDEIRNTLNKIVEYSAGLGVDIPKFNITSSFRFGQNILKTPIGVDSSKIFSNISVYYKPNFLGKLNDSTLFLRLGLNDFNFSGFNKDFREKTITVGVNIPI